MRNYRPCTECGQPNTRTMGELCKDCMKKNVKTKEQKFENAEMATATLAVKKTRGRAAGAYAVVAYLPAGIQDFPEVIGVGDDVATINKYWTMGVEWVERQMGIETVKGGV